MTGEQEVLAAILARLDALVVALDEDLDALGPLPADMREFQAMEPGRRVASRALLKSIEQTEDQLARLFRLVPRLMLVETDRWRAQDFANFAEKLGLLEDSFAWIEIVKLRNRLVHDYPLQPEAQLQLLTQAHAALPTIRKSALTARETLHREGLLDGN